MRGARPWDQFLNYAETVGRIEGSQTYAAMLNDGRLQEVFNQRIEELAGEPHRPQLLGYSREAQQLHRIEVAVVSIHRSLASNPDAIPVPQGPIFPAERYRIEQDALEQISADHEFDLLMGDIYKAMKH